MNDLVRRLREHDGNLGNLVDEAADEIERLRITIALLSQVRPRWNPESSVWEDGR